jgi:hypothetical protein
MLCVLPHTLSMRPAPGKAAGLTVVDCAQHFSALHAGMTVRPAGTSWPGGAGLLAMVQPTCRLLLGRGRK